MIMKIQRRFALLVSLVFLLSGVGLTSAFAVTTVTISSDVAPVGTQVSVPIEIARDAADMINSFVFRLSYDETMLTNPAVVLTGTQLEGATDVTIANPPSDGIGDLSIIGQGILANLFTADTTKPFIIVQFDTGACSGSQAIAFESQNDKTTFADSSFTAITATYTGGSVLCGTATAPTITSLTPSNGAAAGGYNIVIAGTNFVDGATVAFGTTAASSVTFDSATQLTVGVPAGTAGTTANVVVTNPDTEVSAPATFSYDASTTVPTITSLTPSNGAAAGGYNIVIAGTNFVDGATVAFGTTAATNVTFDSATQLTVGVPAGTAGTTANVVVTNPNTEASTPATFSYDAASTTAPSITSITPSNGASAGGYNVVIAGTNFVDGATVMFGSTAATNVTFDSATQLTVGVPAGTAGTASNVIVTNPNTEASAPVSFTYDGGGATGMLGDADDNGDVNIFDALLVAKFDVGMVDASEINEVNANADCTAPVDINDALKIAEYDVGKITELVCQ